MAEIETILWAANTYWDSPFQVGANNLAREMLGLGLRIAFISDPISPLHLLAPGSKDTFTGRLRTWRRGGSWDHDGRLFYYSPMALAVPQNRPLLRSRAVLDHWPAMSLPNVVERVRSSGFGTPDLLIVDTPAQHFWLDRVRYGRSVVRITDLLAGFEKATPHILAKERAMIRRADAVVYTARSLSRVVQEAGARRSAYIPNGITTDRLRMGDRSLPEEFQSIPAPRVLYVGALESWFDTRLVADAARRYPEFSFVIIGPARCDLGALAGCTNVHLLGTRSPRELTRYLWNADVGIIPFDPSHPVIPTVHPIKLYEYIACELPVVSTRWDELDGIPLDFVRAESGPAFIAAIGDAVARGKRTQDLAQFSWRHAAERLLETVLEAA